MDASVSDTRHVAEAWFAALDRGDISSALSLLADDVSWEHMPTLVDSSDIVPWLGRRHGMDAVGEAFRRRDEAVRNSAFRSSPLVVDGDQAVSTVHEHAVVKATGLAYDIECACWLHIANGKIIRWRAYYDPTAIITAFRGDMKARLVEAVENDNLDDVRTLLRHGADPNARDPRTTLTALMLAAGHANAAIVQALLEAGADPMTAEMQAGLTALHKACQGGNPEVARLLLDAGVFLDTPSPTMGHTAAMDALWYKSPALVRYLVEHQPNLHLGTHYGFTFADHLQFETDVNATEADKREMQEMDAIFAAHRQEIEGEIARQTVMAATVAGDLDGVKAALAAGAEVDAIYPHVNSFQDGHTPLLVAARDGHIEIVEMLLRAGANVRAVDWVFRAMPIHKATYTGNVAILKLLMSHPDIDLDVQGAINGYTPLHDALWHGHGECAELLINGGARLDLRGHDGKLPLAIALDTFGPDAPIVGLIRARMATASTAATQVS